MFRVEWSEKFSNIICEKDGKCVGVVDNTYLEKFCQAIGVAVVTLKKEETKNGI